MTDIDVLQECRWAIIEQRAITRQIEKLTQIGGPRGIGSQALEPAGDRKTNNAVAGHLQQLEGLVEKLVQKRDENITIIKRAETVIERIHERKDRTIIRLYYVEAESDYEIAEEVGMSQQWVQQRRSKTIDQLAVKNIRV